MKILGKLLGTIIALPFALALLLLDVPFKLWAATRLAWRDEASFVMPPASLVQDNEAPRVVH